MYSKSVVGLANATSAGWGNMGGGVTNLVMPFVFSAIYNLLDGTQARPNRIAACIHLVAACDAYGDSLRCIGVQPGAGRAQPFPLAAPRLRRPPW